MEDAVISARVKVVYLTFTFIE
ncbi:hypothetical protein CEXT_358681, partial [Caerostris extrusa]